MRNLTAPENSFILKIFFLNQSQNFILLIIWCYAIDVDSQRCTRTCSKPSPVSTAKNVNPHRMYLTWHHQPFSKFQFSVCVPRSSVAQFRDCAILD